MIFPEHQLKVFYPYGGEHCLLVWYERDEGNHLLIAKTPEQAIKLFGTIIDRYPYAEVKNFFRATIVAPTQEQCEAYAQGKLESDVRLFWDIYANSARSYHEKNKALPPKMKWCEKFVPDYEDANEDDEHWNCLNCNHTKIVPASGTIEEMYLAHRETFLQKLGQHGDPRAVKSLAPAQDPNKICFVMVPDFGHHHEGLVSEDVKHLRTQDVMFFYQDVSPIDKSKCDAMVEEQKRFHETATKEREDKWEQEKIEREKEEFEDLLKIFG